MRLQCCIDQNSYNFRHSELLDKLTSMDLSLNYIFLKHSNSHTRCISHRSEKHNYQTNKVQSHIDWRICMKHQRIFCKCPVSYCFDHNYSNNHFHYYIDYQTHISHKAITCRNQTKCSKTKSPFDFDM